MRKRPRDEEQEPGDGGMAEWRDDGKIGRIRRRVASPSLRAGRDLELSRAVFRAGTRTRSE